MDLTLQIYLKKKEKNIVILGDLVNFKKVKIGSFMFLQNNKNISPLIFIDPNKIQSDTWVNHVKNYSKLKDKIKSFNLNFKEINGHTNFKSLNQLTIILINKMEQQYY